MKKVLFVLISVVVSLSAYSQHFALKNNLIYDATLTPNLGMEIGLGKKTTLDINAGYNPFSFDKNKQFQHWLVQPELRFWFCERFSGGFFGIHAFGGQYDIRNIDMPGSSFSNWKDHRFDGYMYGGGISIGYQWVLAKHWNLELSVGGGYARFEYDKYGPEKGAPKIESSHYNYWGPTKATLAIIYVIH